MNKKIFIMVVTLLLFGLVGCGINDTPSKKVESLLIKYQQKSENILDELKDYMDSSSIDEDYSDVYERQYDNLRYEIKDEMIDGDTATVTAQIEVYDYYKTEIESNNYISSNPEEFSENETYIPEKALKYRMENLLNTKDRIEYTVTFNLVKVDDKWDIQTLDGETLEKIHGLYAH